VIAASVLFEFVDTDLVSVIIGVDVLGDAPTAIEDGACKLLYRDGLIYNMKKRVICSYILLAIFLRFRGREEGRRSCSSLYTLIASR